MRAVRPVLAIGLLATALVSAQTVAMVPPRFDLEEEPPDPPLRFAEGSRVSDFSLFVGGGIMVHRFLRDDSRHVFLGYDLLIQSQRQADTYRRRNGKLPIPGYPARRFVYTGNTISVDLGTDPDTGQKLVDYIMIQPRPTPSLSRIVRPFSTVPTVSGTARNFSAEDAEMQLVQPRVSVNGARQDTSTSRGN